jgi:hypothetical protein
MRDTGVGAGNKIGPMDPGGKDKPERLKMKALFSAQQQQAKQVSFAGKTVVGIAAALLISAASVAGMSQQTGANPAHWSGNVAQAQQAAPAAAASQTEKIQLASR